MTLPSLTEQQKLSLQATVQRYTQAAAPEDAEHLLLVCAALYINSDKSDTYNDYLEGARAIFKCWYTEQDKVFREDFNKYGLYSTGSACTCGRFSSGSYSLIYHCTYCEGSANIQRVVTAYAIQRLAINLNLNQYYLESIFAKAITHYLGNI